jgi:hypothetical protein
MWALRRLTGRRLGARPPFDEPDARPPGAVTASAEATRRGPGSAAGQIARGPSWPPTHALAPGPTRIPPTRAFVSRSQAHPADDPAARWLAIGAVRPRLVDRPAVGATVPPATVGVHGSGRRRARQARPSSSLWFGRSLRFALLVGMFAVAAFVGAGLVPHPQGGVLGETGLPGPSSGNAAVPGSPTPAATPGSTGATPSSTETTGSTPTPRKTPSPEPTASRAPARTPTPTPRRTPPPTPSPTAPPTPSSTAPPTPSPSVEPTPSESPTDTPSPPPTASPSDSPTPST